MGIQASKIGFSAAKISSLKSDEKNHYKGIPIIQAKEYRKLKTEYRVYPLYRSPIEYTIKEYRNIERIVEVVRPAISNVRSPKGVSGKGHGGMAYLWHIFLGNSL